MTSATRTTSPISPSETPAVAPIAVPAKNMLTSDQISIRAVFPTGPYGDLSSDDARHLEGLLDGARRRVLDFARDGSRPQLHVTAWFTHPRAPARAVLSQHRSSPPQRVAA
jgi:hypothetical protein